MIKLIEIIRELISIPRQITEEIDPREADRDDNAIRTVVQGKRNLGVITVDTSPYRHRFNYFLDMMKAHELELLHVPSNPHKMYIYYKKGAKKEAEELRDIAEKYGGYLAWFATEEESRRIGQILNYNKEAVEEYIRSIDQRKAEIQRKKEGL
jgi:hypothetical protein